MLFVAEPAWLWREVSRSKTPCRQSRVSRFSVSAQFLPPRGGIGHGDPVPVPMFEYIQLTVPAGEKEPSGRVGLRSLAPHDLDAGAVVEVCRNVRHQQAHIHPRHGPASKGVHYGSGDPWRSDMEGRDPIQKSDEIPRCEFPQEEESDHDQEEENAHDRKEIRHPPVSFRSTLWRQQRGHA